MEGFHSDGMRIRKTEDYRKHFVQSACEMAVCWLKKWKYFRCPCGKVERQAKNIRAAEAAWVPQPAKRQKAASLKSLWAPYPFGAVRKPREGMVGGMRCIPRSHSSWKQCASHSQIRLKPSLVP